MSGGLRDKGAGTLDSTRSSGQAGPDRRVVSRFARAFIRPDAGNSAIGTQPDTLEPVPDSLRQRTT